MTQEEYIVLSFALLSAAYSEMAEKDMEPFAARILDGLRNPRLYAASVKSAEAYKDLGPDGIDYALRYMVQNALNHRQRIDEKFAQEAGHAQSL